MLQYINFTHNYKRETLFLFNFMLHTNVGYIGSTIAIAATKYTASAAQLEGTGGTSCPSHLTSASVDGTRGARHCMELEVLGTPIPMARPPFHANNPSVEGPVLYCQTSTASMKRTSGCQSNHQTPRGSQSVPEGLSRRHGESRFVESRAAGGASRRPSSLGAAGAASPRVGSPGAAALLL
jgi:hypothetical protein